jgi:phosphate starvation-inducible protein PhoH
MAVKALKKKTSKTLSLPVQLWKQGENLGFLPGDMKKN